jgi:prevent-host-death family protein
LRGQQPSPRMTKMTIARKSRAWTLADAKAHLSEVVDSALKKGPQVITRYGRKAVVVVAAEEWARKVQRQGTLADFFAASPLRGSGIAIERLNDGPRDLEL